jgi:hypothetical protein
MRIPIRIDPERARLRLPAAQVLTQLCGQPFVTALRRRFWGFVVAHQRDVPLRASLDKMAAAAKARPSSGMLL